MDNTTECPECGKKVGKGSTFCINCGARLTAPKNQTPEDIMKEKKSYTGKYLKDIIDGKTSTKEV